MNSLAPHIALASLWVIYFVSHSWLASAGAKNWLQRHVPSLQSRYRLAYNVLAVLFLIPPLWLTYNINAQSLWTWHPPWKWLADGAALLALIGFAWSLRHYEMGEFLGLSAGQRRLYISPLHRYVRHPWYFFALVLLWTRDMDSAFCVTATAVTLYFAIGSRLEEQKLLREFGEPYARYRERVPCLLPNPWHKLDATTAKTLEQKAQAHSNTPRVPE